MISLREMRRSFGRVLVAASLLMGAAQALAVMPDEILSDANLEARARHLSAGLRCLVCQNQSIDDSDAPLARDLRLLVRERLKAGDSDEDVTAFIVARYGDFVLLKPPFTWHTALLWAAPALLLVVAVFAIARNMSRRSNESIEAMAHSRLSEEERAKLEAVLKDRP